MGNHNLFSKFPVPGHLHYTENEMNPDHLPALYFNPFFSLDLVKCTYSEILILSPII